MLLAKTLLLAILAGASAEFRNYYCAISERVTEGNMVTHDFGRFELVIEVGNDGQHTAVLSQTDSAGDWQARFTLQSDEAGTLWFDADHRRSESQATGVDALSLNLVDGALALHFEWTLPTAPGEPNLVIAQAALRGWCCAEGWPREGRCGE